MGKHRPVWISAAIMLSLCCALLLTSPLAMAEEPTKLDDLPVVAPPIIEGNQIGPLGSQVTVVSEQQIEDLNANDLPSALRRTPGVVISRYDQIGSFGGGQGAAVYIRGMGSGRPGQDIMTLMDGIPVFVGVWTHSVMDVLSIDNAHSVEVYKGAQPVTFGNMTFGAINIVPKYKDDEGFATKFKLAGGSYGTMVEEAEHGGRIDAFDYYLVQSFRQSDGHREDSGGQLQNYYANVGYRLGDTLRFSVLLNDTYNWADDPGPEGQPQLKDGRFKTRDRLSILKLDNQNSWGSGYLKAYYDEGHLDWQEQHDGSDTRTDYDNYGVRLAQTLKPWSGGAVTLGLDQDYISGKVLVTNSISNTANASDRQTFRLTQPYAMLSQDITLGELLLTPSAGLRHFDHSQFGSKDGYQAGLTARRGDSDLHAAYAHAYNYPGVYVVQQSNLFWGGSQLWKDLEPEELNHFEAGVGHRFNKLVKADLTYFKDKGENRLVFTAPPPHWVNVGSFDNQGLEATITLTPHPKVSLFGGATYLDRWPNDLPYAPEWSGSAGLNWRFAPGFMLNLDSIYVGEQYVTDIRYSGTRYMVDSFLTCNAKVSYSFMVEKVEYTVFVSGENLTDQEYYYRQGYPMPGINGMLGLEFRF